MGSWNLLTNTSWQKTKTKVNLQSIIESFRSYPLVERKFFDDINYLCRKENHYYVEMGLLHLVNEEKKELNPDLWILIWARDFKDRIFQILFERHPDYHGKGTIVALGPPELFEFFSNMKKNAILPTLTLINSPEKMKSVVVVVSRPKSYKQKTKEKNDYQALGRFQNWINELKSTPNVKGQWFPSNAPICPVCKGPLVGIADDYNVAFGYVICPECGYMNRKKIGS